MWLVWSSNCILVFIFMNSNVNHYACPVASMLGSMGICFCFVLFYASILNFCFKFLSSLLPHSIPFHFPLLFFPLTSLLPWSFLAFLWCCWDNHTHQSASSYYHLLPGWTCLPMFSFLPQRWRCLQICSVYQKFLRYWLLNKDETK